MNKEAYEKTVGTSKVTFFSRTKQRLWTKGEESGNFLNVVSIKNDCDNDTLLIKVKPEGPTCHKGTDTCWNETNESSFGFLSELENVIKSRRMNADAEKSYVASLFNKGENSILKKIVEEAGELCFAIKDNDEKEVIYEATDLLFHTLIALGYKNISPDRIKQELQRRMGISGIEEKNSRK